MYEEEPQVVCDVVVADSEEAATAKVTAMREGHGGGWEHTSTTLLADELAALQKLFDTPDAEIEANWLQFIADVGLKACVICKKWISEDELQDEVCEDCIPKLPDCTDCGEKVAPCNAKMGHLDCHKGCDARPKCRHCGEHYDEGGDGYDGMCPSCADKTDGNCSGCGKSLGNLEPDDIVVDGELKFCNLACEVKYLKTKVSS
jgi:hypothetical protein